MPDPFRPRTCHRSTMVFLALFLVSLAVPLHAWALTNLTFDQPARTLNTGEILAVPIIINADETIHSADVYMNYDKNYLEVTDTVQGDFFPNLSSRALPGQYYVAGTPEGVTGKKGTGRLATVNFTAKQAGTTQLTFDCRGNTVNNTSKLNINPNNPQNIIDCSSTSSQLYTVTINTPPTNGANVTPAVPTLTPSVTGTIQPGGGNAPGTVQPGTPTTLPRTGSFDGTLGYAISGSLFLGLGGLMKRLVGNF